MIRHDAPRTEELPRFLRLRLDSPDNPERPAAEEALPAEVALGPHDPEEQELTFENKHPDPSRQQSPSHQHLGEENEFLKEQLERIKERIGDYEEMLRNFKEVQEELTQREHELYEKESAIGLLTGNLRALEKRKAHLEFELQRQAKLV